MTGGGDNSNIYSQISRERSTWDKLCIEMQISEDAFYFLCLMSWGVVLIPAKHCNSLVYQHDEDLWRNLTRVF